MKNNYYEAYILFPLCLRHHNEALKYRHPPPPKKNVSRSEVSLYQGEQGSGSGSRIVRSVPHIARLQSSTLAAICAAEGQCPPQQFPGRRAYLESSTGLQEHHVLQSTSLAEKRWCSRPNPYADSIYMIHTLSSIKT